MLLVFALILSAISVSERNTVLQLLQAGRMVDALALLEPMAKQHPTDPQVLGLLGRARLHAGDAAGAVAPLQSSLKSLPNDGEGINNLGVAFMQLQRLDEAVLAFARAVVLLPRQAQTWRNLAGAYTRLERHQDAAKSWARYLSFRPKDSEANCVYGGVLLALGRHRDAAVRLRSGVKQTKDTVCLHDYADVLGRLGEPVQALAILDRLSKLDTKDAHAHYLRSYILIDASKDGGAAALDAIERSLVLAPKRPASHHLHGYILQRFGRHEEALKAYSRASELAPKRDDFLRSKILARVRVGEGESVEKSLRLMLGRDSSLVEIRRALAHLYMGKKQWQKSIKILQQAPKKTAALQRDVALVLMQSGQSAQAATLLKSLIKTEPKNRNNYYNLALALRRSAAMNDALVAVKAARKMEGSGEDELLLEGRILLELGRSLEVLTLTNSSSAPSSYDHLYLRARALRMRSRLKDALKGAKSSESAAKNEQERLAARRLQGKILTDLGRGAEAIGLFREKGSSAAELGIALSRAGRSKEAVSVLRRELRRSSDDVDVHLALAAALQGQGKQNEALKVLRSARGRWPRHGGLSNDTAMAVLFTGKRRRAIALLKQGVVDNPGHSALVRNYARHLSSTKRHRQAIDILRTALRLRPNIGALHTALGEILMGQKRNEEARSSFRQALSVGTPDPLAQARLGDLWRRSGKLDQAIKAYKQALAQRPGMLEAHNGLGMALHGLERFKEAVAQYRSGLTHAHGDAELNNNMGSSFYLLGRFPEALSAFERSAKRDPAEVRYWRNQIMVLKELGRFLEAQKRLEAAFVVHPGHASLKNEALSLERAIALRKRMNAKPDEPRQDKAPH
jgi:tetratricopeptide (TPR) repeat protein